MSGPPAITTIQDWIDWQEAKIAEYEATPILKNGWKPDKIVAHLKASKRELEAILEERKLINRIRTKRDAQKI